MVSILQFDNYYTKFNFKLLKKITYYLKANLSKVSVANERKYTQNHKFFKN